ncbi:hypothetical protein HPB51_017107 [Rhipicephalus microplus]|uniref:Transposase Tc1-like domain-containing protein n=1 Tax=Rhipicephalus microplus TaxID=6941 RepID=A0A9J6DHY0_RHIMP|nr:hypothetical protein HPB51_017107 [Rhipicephalus microplus]
MAALFGPPSGHRAKYFGASAISARGGVGCASSATVPPTSPHTLWSKVRVPESERWEIVELYFKGRSQRKIAGATGRTLKTVNRIVRAFKSCRRIKNAPRKPRSRVTTEQEDAWIVAAAAVKPGLSAQQIKNTLDLRASVTTVKRHLREAGLKSGIAAQKPLIRAQNKKKQLQFSRQHAQRSSEEWNQVVFKDEYTFTTSCDQQARIWRPDNTRPSACSYWKPENPRFCEDCCPRPLNRLSSIANVPTTIVDVRGRDFLWSSRIGVSCRHHDRQ